MAYATMYDVMARYRPLTTMVGTGDFQVTSDEVSSVFVWQSDALIDAKAGFRYAVPLPPNPLITMISCDLSIHAMLAEKITTVPEFIDKRYKRAMDLLDDIWDGKLVITSATAIGSAGDNYAWSSTMGYTPIFSPVLPAIDQRPDPDRVDQDLSDRGYDSICSS